MFSYEERNAFLHHINPVIKIIISIVLTVLVSLSFFPVLPAAVLLLLALTMRTLGGYKVYELFWRSRFFIFVCLSFAVFLLFGRGLGQEGSYTWLIFGWEKEDFIYALSLALRILTLAWLSMFLVLTTNPTQLILSLILQLKVPFIYGYATLAAYRFLPTFKSEAEKIKLARAIRGGETGQTFMGRLFAPFSLAIPLLAVAVRRGERVSVAMECRALGVYENRTYYKPTSISSGDKIFLLISLLIIVALVILLIYSGLFRFNVGFNL